MTDRQREYKRTYNARYRLANAERLRKYRRKYYSEQYKEKSKEYYEERRDAKIAGRLNEWITERKERREAIQKQNAPLYRARVLERNRNWRRNNRDKVNAGVRKYYQSDLNALILHRLRTRIAVAFRTQATSKAFKTSSLLGCSMDSFRIYIESKFEPGMTWDTYGKGWHLDHIVPCAMFDLTKSDHQKICFHFSNYQPLFAMDNAKKGNRLFHSPEHLPL